MRRAVSCLVPRHDLRLLPKCYSTVTEVTVEYPRSRHPATEVPMRSLSCAALVIAFAGLLLADEPRAVEKKPAAVTDWKSDPACKLVFFAVLQGLYEDGVGDDVVNSIVPADKKGAEKMRHSFVLDCPLCLPAYEAFCAYQARPRFFGEDKPAALGKGLPEEVVTGLLSKNLAGRLITLRGPIKKWVEARLVSMKLSESERQKWWLEIAARSGQGKTTLNALKAKDEWYKNWSGYWGCAACLGSEDACRELQRSPAPPKE